MTQTHWGFQHIMPYPTQMITDGIGHSNFNIQGSAGCNRDSFYSQRSSINASIFNEARNTIPNGRKYSRRARDLIDDLDFYINLYDVRFNLPKILIDVCPDEIYFEWIFAHFRIGLLIHNDENSDAWFIVGDTVMNDVDEKYKLDIEGMMRIANIVRTYGNES